jgi:hypothetical protein
LESIPKFEYITSGGNKLIIFRSYKTDQVTVMVEVGRVKYSRKIEFDERKLNSAIDETCKLSDGSDPNQGLVEGLMRAQWLYLARRGVKLPPRRTSRTRTRSFLPKVRSGVGV